MYKVTFDLPNLAKGAEFAISGLGVFKNGGEYVIEDEEAEAFRLYHQRHETTEEAETYEVPVGDGEVALVPHHKVVNGPTVLQALKSINGVTVEKYREGETAAEKKARLKQEEEERLAQENANNDNNEGGE